MVPKRTITEVAFRSGFNDLSSFDRNFCKRYGASPRNVRSSGQANGRPA
ncbi:helix-turn-helix domain-containing protein [Sphingobium olei]|uniref:Helix-turn-helix domain-containing protein n=1 Tax=Sphingobium olei TaxID=420955 RepID=A0ABW3P788_9SPHN|nr:helix-turn-helix domain-containing protein [Sphingobium sp.]